MDSNLFRRETPDEGSVPAEGKHPTSSELRRWRQYLADEQAEAAVYRDLAGRRTGEEREILFALADAEGRHEKHWRALLGDQIGKPRRAALRTRILGFLARHFGSVFVLALAQRAEDRSTYDTEVDATAAMAADEHMHGRYDRTFSTSSDARAAASAGSRNLSHPELARTGPVVMPPPPTPDPSRAAHLTLQWTGR